MVTEAKAAYGTQLFKGGVGGTAIAEVTSIGGMPLDSDEIDVTHLTSDDGFEEVIQGIRRTGAISIEGNFIPGDTNGQIALLTDYYAGTVDDYAIVFPAALAAVWEFRAFVKKPPSENEAAVDGKIPFSAELRITGKPELSITYSNNLSGLTGIEEEVGGALTLVPTFAGGTYEYAVTVNTASTYIKLTPAAASGVITVNGNTVSTGTETGEIPLGAAGSITTVTIKVKETDKIARNYTLTVMRP
ncbi:MAG: phage tail tube protein [Anaerovoracaceae bacterium]